MRCCPHEGRYRRCGQMGSEISRLLSGGIDLEIPVVEKDEELIRDIEKRELRKLEGARKKEARFGTFRR